MTANTTSADVIQSMFNHLASSYSVDEARELLTQKYPGAEDIINSINVNNYRVTQVEMGSKIKVIEPKVESDVEDLKRAVKAKTSKPKAEKEDKGESKADIARRLYAEAADKSRGAMIAVFMEQLGMSKAAASTYFYNVKS